MTPSSEFVLNPVWLHYVLEPAARALALAGAAWLLLAAFRVREVSIRLAVWTTILYAALAIPFLGRVIPQIPIPLLSAPAAQQMAGNTPVSTVGTGGSAGTIPVLVPAVNGATVQGSVSAVSATKGQASTTERPFSWASIALFAYLLVVSILMARFFLGLALGWRLRRAGSPIGDERLQELLVREAHKAGLGKSPRIAECSKLSIPATLGVLRPIILLPVEWNEWNDAHLSAVLAHEMSHIARHDPFTQSLSRLHRAIFWFSPLSWCLDRTIVELAEQASDDAALRSGTDPIRYAEVLLHFFRALKAARGRVQWQGVSMAQGSRSERRLERVLGSPSLSQRLGRITLGAITLVAVPLICLAAAVQPSRTAPIPALPPAAPPPPPPMALIQPTPPSPGFARRVPAVVASAPHAHAHVKRVRAKSRWNDRGCRGDEAFAVVSGRTVSSECSSAADLDHVWKLHRSIPTSFLWFRSSGRSYVIRDPEIVRAALDVLAPQQAIGRQQAALARRQAELGVRQAFVHFEVPNYSTQIEELESQLRALDSPAGQQALNGYEDASSQADWEALRRQLATFEVVAAINLAVLHQQQAALGEQQAAIERLQFELGRQQAELACKVAASIRRLIDQSLARGLARPV